MYLWRRSATQKWLNENEDQLRAVAGDQVAIIERPNRKRLQIEVASESRAQLDQIAKQFGGRIQKLERDWLKRALRQKTKPIKIGNEQLIIPAGAAFGTGEHATTTMCLRMLERAMSFGRAQSPSPALFGASPRSLSEKSSRSRGRDRQHARRVRSPETVVDLGTGSGILALVAKILGAKRAIGIDNDPIAISTAKQNARLNKVRDVQFRTADVRHWKSTSKIGIVTANLYSELLIKILPKLKSARRLILSGFLRNQERDMRRSLTRNKLKIIEVRKRGKWVAILAGRR